MKANIHPHVNPVIFIDEDTGDEVISQSTMTSDETREVDGVQYYVIRLDVTAFSHPFFTGEMRFVDRQGRVDKFMQKMQNAQHHAATRGKKTATKAQQASKSYREILQDQQLQLKQAAKATEQPAVA